MQRKGPLPGKICARCIPERRFAGLFGYMAHESCQGQLILDAWRRYIAREGHFSRPRPLRGCMRRKTCYGKASENASEQFIATAGRLGTYHGEILPPPDVGGQSAHISSLPAGRERISRVYCHRRTAESASRIRVAVAPASVECIAHAHRRTVCSLGAGHWYAQPVEARGGIGHFAFSGFNCQEQLRVCAVSVGNHEPTSRSAKLCRIMS